MDAGGRRWQTGRVDKRLPLGIGLVLAGTLGAVLGIAPMLDVGTCASGGPYVVAQECPSDYEWRFWVMFAGIIVAIAGILLVFIAAGEPTGFALLSLVFVAVGIASLVKARSLEGDSQLGLDIVGWIFVPLGVGGLVMARFMHRAERRAPNAR